MAALEKFVQAELKCLQARQNKIEIYLQSRHRRAKSKLLKQQQLLKKQQQLNQTINAKQNVIKQLSNCESRLRHCQTRKLNLVVHWESQEQLEISLKKQVLKNFSVEFSNIVTVRLAVIDLEIELRGIDKFQIRKHIILFLKEIGQVTKKMIEYSYGLEMEVALLAQTKRFKTYMRTTLETASNNVKELWNEYFLLLTKAQSMFQVNVDSTPNNIESGLRLLQAISSNRARAEEIVQDLQTVNQQIECLEADRQVYISSLKMLEQKCKQMYTDCENLKSQLARKQREEDHQASFELELEEIDQTILYLKMKSAHKKCIKKKREKQKELIEEQQEQEQKSIEELSQSLSKDQQVKQCAQPQKNSSDFPSKPQSPLKLSLLNLKQKPSAKKIFKANLTLSTSCHSPKSPLSLLRSPKSLFSLHTGKPTKATSLNWK